MLLFLAGFNFAQNVPAYVPTIGLVGWWPFSGNAIDSSGNGNNGTVNGATLTADRNGVANRAYSFDGVNDNINPLQNNLPLGTNSRSVSLWFKRIGNGGCLFSYGTANTGNAFMISIGTNIIANQGWTNPDFPVFPTIDNAWHHVVCTYDGAFSRIYFDTALLGTGNMAGLNTILGSFYFGTRVLNDMDFFNGNLDDIGIWNRVLTQQEISALYNSCNLTVNLQPSNQFASIGSNVQLSLSTSSSNASFQWQTDLGTGFVNVSNSGQYSGANNDTLQILNLTIANNNQQFRCIITSGACTDTTNIASLTICYAITTQPQSQTVLNGTNAEFVTSIQDPGATYQWQTDLGFGFLNLSNSGQYNGVSNDTLTISNVSTANNNQQFRCIINSGTCSDTSEVAVLSVNSSTSTSILYDHSVNIYPNPNSGEFEISISENLLGTGYYITDYLGNRISRGILNKIQNDITIEELASGVYFLQLDKKSVKIFKIIKL
jgi:hypothetical protein